MRKETEMAKKVDAVDAPQEAKKKRKVSPIHVEEMTGTGEQVAWQQIGDGVNSVKVAREHIKKIIEDGSTMRIVRVLGTYQRKVVQPKVSLALV
jgi:hypothetical protein